MGNLSKGGAALHGDRRISFSERYGWLQDRYGLSWQIMLMGKYEIAQKITPTLMFVDKLCGKAKDTIGFYATVFRNAEVGDILRYSPDEDRTSRDG